MCPAWCGESARERHLEAAWKGGGLEACSNALQVYSFEPLAGKLTRCSHGGTRILYLLIPYQT